MSRPSTTYIRLFVLFVALLLCVSPVCSATWARDGKDDNKGGNKGDKKVVRVKQGQSIQDAIDHAKPYTRIEVEGEHREQITISKDGISLIGKGAKLSSPNRYDKYNYCYGLVQNGEGKNTSAGICIHGRDIELAAAYNPDSLHWKVERVGNPVKAVSVSGFEITGFDGETVAVYGGKNTKILRNKLKGGLRYGFLTVGSTGTEASNNIIIGSTPATLAAGPIAMCMDDFSSAVFSQNDISDYFIGLCTETSEGVNKDNKIHECCIGNIIDPNVSNAKSLDNDISQWNKGCPSDSAAGISLLGAKNAVIKGNKVNIGFTGLTPPLGGAGLFVGDIFGPVNEGNQVTYNVFGENDADIFDISKGRNYIKNNKCDVAFRNTTTIIPAPEYCQ